MIVRQAPHALHLITQPDHAQLARRVMEHAEPLRGHPRREAILHATGEHDCGWRLPDLAPSVNRETGEVIDFVRASLEIRQGTSLDGIEMLAAHAWPAALVAQHRLEVYNRYRGVPEWGDYFATAEAMRLKHLATSGRSLADLEADYRFVRLGDLISLTFCTGWTTAEAFDEFTVRFDGERVVVTPDTFGGAVVPMAIEAAQIRKPPFASDAELREELKTAKRVVIRASASASTSAVLIYKLAGDAEWRAAERTGVFEGSEVDRRDGFIHFSTAEQVEETARRHFAGRTDLLLVAVDTTGLEIRWEPSRGGQLFPHLYGPLPMRAVRSVERFEL